MTQVAAGAVGLLVATDARAQWQASTGPRPPNVVSIAQGDGTLFLGATQHDTGGPVYRSLDNGQSWILTEGGTPLELFPHHDGIVYGGGVYVGLWRSDDDGINWSRVTGVPTNGSGVVLAACGDALYARVSGITESPRLYRSTNDGASWTAAAGGLPNLTPYSDVRCLGATVLAAVGSDIYRSVDAGSTWTPVGTGLPAGAWVDVLAAGDGAFWAGVSGDAPAFGVYRSPDGQVWTRVGLALAPVSTVRFQDLVVEPGELLAAVAGQEPFDTGDAGLHRSTDGGMTWARVWNGFANPAQAIARVGGDLLLGSGAGPFRSSDNGVTWTYTGTGTARVVAAPAVVAFNDMFLAGTNDQDVFGDVWRSSDSGSTWMSAEIGLPQNSHAVALLNHDGAVYAGVYGAGRGVFRSVNAGASWSTSSGIPGTSIIHTLHAHGDVMLTGAFEGMYRSTDDGETWTLLDGAPTRARAFVSDGAVLYAGTPGGIYRSSDGGTSWSSLNAGLPSLDVHALIRTPAGLLLAGLEEAGVYRFVGEAWVPSGLSGMTINAFLVVDDLLLAGGSSVAYSTNQGVSWTFFDDGLIGLAEVLSLAATDEKLLAGTAQGLWIRPVADLQVPTSTPTPLNADGFHVGPIRPNPFGRTATLTLEVGRSQPVVVTVVDAIGRRVAVLHDGPLAAGTVHTLVMDGVGLPPGVYVVRVTGADYAASRRAVVVR